MKAWPVVPGVPAAGHVTASGWWHPGSPDGCVKCEGRPGVGKEPPIRDRRADQSR